jgi:alpha-beta hydrolase superfamily lysophospholipase
VELAPRLIDVETPPSPAGVALVLHGGASRRGNPMVSPTQLSVLRMIPIASRVARATRGQVAVYRLLNSARGWDTQHTPVQDAGWALAQIAERHGERLPTCLVGHSLGGRAALLSAGLPEVRSVAALAPWVYPSDAPDRLDGQRILIVHGTEDRIADPDRSAALARSIARRASVSYVSVHGGKHAMLHRHGVFDGLAAEFVAATLLDRPASETMRRVLAGERYIDV